MFSWGALGSLAWSTSIARGADGAVCPQHHGPFGEKASDEVRRQPLGVGEADGEEPEPLAQGEHGLRRVGPDVLAIAIQAPHRHTVRVVRDGVGREGCRQRRQIGGRPVDGRVLQFEDETLHLVLDDGLDVRDGPLGEELGQALATCLMQVMVDGGKHGFGLACRSREPIIAFDPLRIARLYFVVERGVADVDLVGVDTHNGASRTVSMHAAKGFSSGLRGTHHTSCAFSPSPR